MHYVQFPFAQQSNRDTTSGQEGLMVFVPGQLLDCEGRNQWQKITAYLLAVRKEGDRDEDGDGQKGLLLLLPPA